MVVVDAASGAADVIETVGSVSLTGLAFDGLGGGGAGLAFLRAGADFANDSRAHRYQWFVSRGGSIRDRQRSQICRVIFFFCM